MAVRGPRPLHGAGGAGPCWPGAGCPGALVAGACLASDPVLQQRLSRGGYALTSAAALGSGAEVLWQRWPPRACPPGVGSAEPARAAVTHTRTADGPVFPQPPCDPCSVTPSVPEGGYLARGLAKRWWFQKGPYCFSSEWPDRWSLAARREAQRTAGCVVCLLGAGFPPRLICREP